MSSQATVQRPSSRVRERPTVFARLRTSTASVPIVRDVMSTDIMVCQRSDSCGDVAERMRQGNVGILPVMDGKDVVGVVTDRDLALRHMAAGSSTKSHSTIGGCMTAEVVSVSPEASLEEAVVKMRENQVRRLLVLERGAIQGILTLDDILVETGRSDETGRIVQAALVGPRRP